MQYLDELNPPQREGVVKTEGPTLIIAGAGSGKTRVLTYRIAYLMHEHKVDPYNILALTFTNKAAGEMRHRVEAIAGTEARSLWMGTFHSVFARILRSEAGHLGYPNNFTIYDTDDSKTLLKQIVKELSLDDKLYKANVCLNRISAAKNRLVSWQEYNQNPIYLTDDEAAQRPKMGLIYRLYVDRCFKAGAMDFDDLLFNTNVLFRDHDDVLHKYQHRFRYVLVDEFQDTNLSQYLITRKLSAVHQNIAVVGDDAQSIYAFRGADIQNILNFEKDFPELNTIKLEQNYRSSNHIVQAANSVIKHNQNQLNKDVWTANDDGDYVEVIKATSDNEEGRLVASTIFEEKANKQLSNLDFAILYRTNSQSRAIEEALRRQNIKYKVVGGLSFYQRKEIKDLLGYLRFVVNTNDEQALRRVINLPRRGIGTGTVNKIMVAAEEHGVSLWEVLQNVQQYIGGRAATAVANFVVMIERFIIDMRKRDAYETAQEIAKGSGLLRELYEDKTIEGLSRYENVQEMLNAVKEFVDNPETPDKSLAAFLQEVTLLTSQDEGDDDPDKVTLMTIHMAKGLEFKHVFVVGMEEDLFPSQMMLESRADLEEERRLFYVAVTRAMHKLYLTYALTRYRFGRLKNCEPSRFLEEMDPSVMHVNKQKSASNPVGQTYLTQHFSKPALKARVANRNAPSPNQKVHTPSKDFAPSDTSQLSEGMQVEHPKFGFGKVAKIDDQGAQRKATVTFEKVGNKTLLLSFAKLRILD